MSFGFAVVVVGVLSFSSLVVDSFLHAAPLYGRLRSSGGLQSQSLGGYFFQSRVSRALSLSALQSFPLPSPPDDPKLAAQFSRHLQDRINMKYQIIAAPAMAGLAQEITQSDPERFTFHPTTWDKFPDGTDNIMLSGMSPYNLLSGENVVFLASFHSNDATLSQFQVLIQLCWSFIGSLTVVLPYYPTGTMERVTTEGEVATGATFAHMLSSLPSCGQPCRVMTYDLHTLQNRFYLSGNAIASLQTTIPLLQNRIDQEGIANCIAFPDDGAAKRFKPLFDYDKYQLVTCGKTRDGDTRKVVIQDGSAKGKHVVIVDDLVQTGGTLYECGKALLSEGALSVSAFVAHAVFPNSSYQRFDVGGDRCVFRKFYVTASIPTVTDNLPVENGIFEVFNLGDIVVRDLDCFTST